MIKRILVALAIAALVLVPTAAVSAEEGPYTTPYAHVHSKQVAVNSTDWLGDVDLLVGEQHQFTLSFHNIAQESVVGEIVILVLGESLSPGDAVLEVRYASPAQWVELTIDENFYAEVGEMELAPQGAATLKLRATFQRAGSYRFTVWFVESEEP